MDCQALYSSKKLTYGDRASKARRIEVFGKLRSIPWIMAARTCTGSTLMSIINHSDGVLTTTLVIHGTESPVEHLQAALAIEINSELAQAWIHWIEEIMLHKDTEME